MKFNLKKIIEANYDLNVISISYAPRQFVAQTFVIKTKKGNDPEGASRNY